MKSGALIVALGPLLFVFTTGTALSQERPNPLPAARLVNKLSLVTTGQPASRATIEQFQNEIAANPNDFEDLYSDLIDKHLATPEYEATIERLHALWWRIPLGTVAKHAGYVVATNRSYEEIYVRDYIYADSTMSDIYRQLNAQTLTDLPTMPGDVRRVPLAQDERRFRGLFGTPEFLFVYPDTSSNVNRKRSSQVFRIAFCETLANLPSQLEAIHSTIPKFDDDHAQNPDCVGCHKRLDPMARFFDRWLPPSVDGFYAEYDPNRPNQGQVYLGGVTGMQRGYPGSGESELGAIIVRQPEFSSCVSNLAWQYAFGREVALDESTKSHLVEQYNSTKRFNVVVKEALLHPYFWSDATAPAINYANIRPILQDCAGCHAGSSRTQFDPSNYPLKNDAVANFNLVKRIWSAINYYPGYRPMPESPRPKIEQENLDLIRTWIMSGGQDAAGNSTLTQAQIEEIL